MFLRNIYGFQLTEDWGDTLFSALKRAGGKGFSNMAVGYNNVDVSAATKHGISVGNTPVSIPSLFLSVSMTIGIRKSICIWSN